MRVHVVAFATAAEALGSPSLLVTLPAGSRVADLQQHLESAHPKIIPIWPRLAVAVNGELVPAETPLGEGVEVALLPPVSGGSGAPERSGLVDGPLDTGAVVAAVSDPSRGAVLFFEGCVRNHHQGRRVTHLTYDAYRPMAAKRLAAIVEELEASFPDLRAAIFHRLGEVPAGEPSVVIAVASPHRDAAYEGSRQALERLKAEVPIWKREHFADGTASWREAEPLVALPPTCQAES